MSTPYRNASGGGADNRTFGVYGYAMNVDSSKTVSSITLPNDSHVAVLAVDVVD